jgi:hypothetical protein
LRFPSEIPDEVRKYLTDNFLNEHKVEVYTTRRLPNSDREIEWDLEQESDRTQRMLELLCPIYDVLQSGAVLIWGHRGAYALVSGRNEAWEAACQMLKCSTR